MTDQSSKSGTKAVRRIGSKLAATTTGKHFPIEIHRDPLSPWFLEDTPQVAGRPLLMIYGSLRNSGAMLRTAYIVLRSWWHRPQEPEIVSNGSILMTNSLGGISKPVIWMASVGIAAVVGSDVASSNSNVASSEHLVIWINAAFVLVLCLGAYYWWKFLERLRRVLVTWVSACFEKSDLDRRADDIALFGYTFGDDFRRKFKIKGVKFLSILTFSAFMYFSYLVGHQ